MFERACVIGVGLIGGSLARDLRARGLAGHVVGCSRKRQNLERAEALGVIDEGEPSLANAVAGADLVVLAMPLGAMRSVLDAVSPHLCEGAVLTDVGSAKGSVIEDARAAFGALPPGFVPAHPIAGTERSGVDASFEGLFEQRRVIL
ncbi:MAG: prephenate dehydrogenase, partial [Gammaproteobacteria bacterium]